MNDYGTLIAPNTLQFVRMLPGPIEYVWEYLTDPDKRALWFAGGPMELKAGGDVTFEFEHKRLSPEHDLPPEKYKEHENGSTSKATVLECVPPTKLVIDWEGKVSFELEAVEDQVKLTLTHDHLNDERDPRIGVMAGWHTHLDILEDRVKGIDPKGFWAAHMKKEQEYEQKFY